VYRVVVNTGDRFAARKALMKSFQSHLAVFKSGGKHLSSCCDKVASEHGEAMEIDDMMKSKFRRTWRHSMLAWLTFMGLLLLAFVYIDSTDWEDSWYRTPAKYNITELLNMTDDDAIDVVPKNAKAGKKTTETDNTDNSVVDAKVVDNAAATQTKGKTGKKNAETVEEPNHAEETDTVKTGKKM
jgi:hypothetical protein